MSRKCTDCVYCDNDWKDGKTYCKKWRCWVKLSEAESCKDFEVDEGNSGCYLTTACVKSKGLSDDCIELSTLRKFRDEYILNLENGEKDIKEYYDTAPYIVSAINSSDNCNDVYNKLYSEIILPCIDLINNKNYKEAYIKYKNMVRLLEKKYC